MAIEGKADGSVPRRLRLGMVGGGQGAFIGGVHRIAARIDDHYELVAGALSSDPDRARASAAELRIGADRAYGSFAEMAEAEAAREDGIDAVAIVTPNHVHHAAAKTFLESGIHVICDKPMTTSLDSALDLVKTVKRTDLVFGLTHNYTGYPMVRQAREMVEAGALGPIRVIQAEYPQDWLSTRMENEGLKQAEWRTDPERSGPAGCVGDIGTHAFNLAAFITGLEVSVDRRRHLHLCRRPPAGRQRPYDAALPGRRPRHVVGKPGRAGQRERPAYPYLWREGWIWSGSRSIPTSSTSRRLANRHG